MKRIGIMIALGLAWSGVSMAQVSGQRLMNKHYPSNRAPLTSSAFVPLPTGAVKPAGWLKDQLRVQADGLTGHLDEFWPSLTESKWKGGTGEGWERGPYFLDGLVPLAYVLDDARLIEKVEGWMKPMLASGRPDGWFGPADNRDRWPLSVALKVLAQYHEATGDPKVIELMQNYFRYLATHPADWPDGDWRGVRAMETTLMAHWLYNRTGDATLLDVARSIYLHSFNWYSYFLDFPYTTEALEKGLRYSHPTHVVNIGMAVKYPGVWYQQSHDPFDAKAVYEGLKSLDNYHGQVAGRFSGDEHLAGRHPSQGTELCAVVEFMFSLENLVATLGDPMFADRLELLAYNANPGACTADYWAHQYDQQANQVSVSVAKRQWSTNSDTSNVYGLEPNFGCCTANMHQGWPKFVTHMWMATPDNGLAAVALGPSVVKAKVADGQVVTITEDTQYPWEGTVRFTIETASAVKFPLSIRVPDWAHDAQLTAGGETSSPVPGTFAVIDRQWKSGDVVELNLPMNVRIERRYNKSASVLRGPIYYALKIGQNRREIKRHSDKFPVIDWEIQPTTPWNYALAIDANNPAASFEVQVREPGKVPYDLATPPVVIMAKARQVPSWGMSKNSADAPPASPVESDQPLTDVELVPYGSAQLRITEFPVLKEEKAK